MARKCTKNEMRALRCEPVKPDVSLCAALRAAGCGLTSVEPFTVAAVPLADAELRALCGAADVFSPNEREARSLFVDGDSLSPSELVRRMGTGADVVCLRRGERGAMVYDAGRNEGYECPSVALNVVDETGCGNAFCGAFAAALSRGEGIKEGLALGSTAASVMLEHVGVPVRGVRGVQGRGGEARGGGQGGHRRVLALKVLAS